MVEGKIVLKIFALLTGVLLNILTTFLNAVKQCSWTPNSLIKSNQLYKKSHHFKQHYTNRLLSSHVLES